MIKDYLLYFSNNVYKDSLYIHLKRDYQIKDETKFFNDVEVLYKQKEPIVYMIHNISKYIKIWMDGYIYLPSKVIIDVVKAFTAVAAFFVFKVNAVGADWEKFIFLNVGHVGFLSFDIII